MYDNGPKIAFSDLKTELKALLWPNGVPENLVAPIDKAFEDALIDLQTYVLCLQGWHTDVFPQCATYFKCGLTVLDKPRGKIRRVRTFEGEFCDPVTLYPATLQEIYCYSRRFIERITAPANIGLPALPIGFRFADASTDSQFGRAITGLWAIDRERLYVSPWIQSLESVVVEWDGLKRKFSDVDLWPDEQDLKRALRLYVQKEFSRDFERDFAAKQQFTADWMEARADLMYRCEQENRIPQAEPCRTEREYLWDHRLEDDSPDTAEHPTITAFISDYGDGSQTERKLAALVKSWSPKGVLTGGNNNFQNNTSLAYDPAVGAFFRKFIFPYGGVQPLWPGEIDATVNQFWPALGNADNDHFADYLSYFGPLLPGAQKFYDVVIGPVHYLFLDCARDSNGALTDNAGDDANSVQAQWFRDRVGNSTAKWKVAFVNFPPYSSIQAFPGWRWIRGVNAVLSGHVHSYERLLVSGILYLVAGDGCGPLQSFSGAMTGGSQFQNDTVNGAIEIIATCEGITFEFWSVDGVLIDAVTLGVPPVVGTGTIVLPPPTTPTPPPPGFELIIGQPFDPRTPALIRPGDPTYWPEGDPTVWGIWNQTTPTGQPINTFYWNPALQAYV